MSRPETEHLDETKARQLALEPSASPAEHRAHVAGCSRCALEVDLHRGLTELAGGDRPEGCLEPDDVIRLADGTVTEDEAERFGRHVTGCPDCAGLLARLEQAEDAAGPIPVRGAPAERADGLLAAIAALARFEMPPASTLLSRAGDEDGAEGFAEAMSAYERSDHAEAARRLTELSEHGLDRPEFGAYLAASRHAVGDHVGAATALAAAVAQAPKVGEYRWQHAQVLLELGRGEEARAELKRVVRLSESRRAAARAQLAELETVLPEASDGND
ncbi:MAG: tetratricopeptide repeat protein [Acidobacteriota bacterium]